MEMSLEEQERYDNWSKMQIYEAFIVENRKRKELNDELNEARRKLARLKYELKLVTDDM